MPIPPPTSPYLQALERASKGSAAGFGNNGGSRQAIALAGEDGDNDGEGDVCWVCGNATRASQAYCSNTCRDEDNRLLQETAQGHQTAEELLLIDHIDALQLSPAIHAVPALIPSSSSGSSTKPRSGHSSASGNTTPHAATSRRSSGTNTNASNLHLASSNNALTALETLHDDGHRGKDHHHHTSHTSNRRSSRKSGTSSINGITTEASSGTTTTGSSSSPPSSSATSSPAMRTSADEEFQQGGRRQQQPRVEEDIEGLLLPPPAAGVVAEVVNVNGGRTSPNKKQHQQQHQHQHFDYAYPYALRPKSSSGLIIPKSPPPLHVAKTTLPAPGALSSTGMRKSSSQQHNRHTSNGQNKMLSPIFGPKSVGSSLHPEATRSSTAGTNTSNAKNTQHDHTNTPPLKASEVITFRRRHYATDSLNGQHKASNHGGSSTAGSSSTNSPAVKAVASSSTAHASSSSTITTNTTATNTTNSSSSNNSSRRHSSHGSSVLTSPNMLPAFSPLIKARSITSKSIPTFNSVNGQGNNNTHSPKLKAVDSVSSTSASAIQPPQQQHQHAHHHGLSSPSLAASTLSDLLHRTTSKGDSSSTLPAIAGNKRASKSDSLLTGPALASSSGTNHHLRSPGVPATSQGLPSTSSSSALSGTITGKVENTGHNKASWLQRTKLTKNFFSFNGPLSSSSLTGRISDHAQSQSQSPSQATPHATCARKNCPVNHATHPLASFFTPLTRRSSEPGSPFASPAIYYSDNLDPFEESFSKSASGSITSTLKNSALSSGVDGAGVRRRPSLSTSITAPPVITTPSPGVNGVKPQDYSGFAGFLFALHNQRKGGAAATASSPLSPNNDASSKEDSRKASFDIYSTPESSESGYDAQDEEQARLEISSSIRGRGRSSRRANATTTASVSGGVKEKDQTETAHIAKPALLKEKLNNVVRASNDRSSSTTSSTTDPAQVANDVSPARSNGGKPRGFLFSRGNAFKNSSLAPPETKGDPQSTENTEDEVDEVRIVPSHHQKKQEKNIQIEAVNPQDDLSAKQQEELSGRGRKVVSTAPRARHNHSTSVGEGSQYIVNLRGSEGQKAKLSIREEKRDDSSEELTLSDERDSPSRSPERTGVAPNPQQRGRPTARRRSSANGRIAVVSPFTTLERANTFANGEEKQQQLQTEDGGRGRSRARGSAALHRSVSPARSSSRARGRDSPRLRTR